MRPGGGGARGLREATRALTAAGHEVRGPFRSAPELLAEAARRWPDVCVVDVDLDGDGREAAAELVGRFGARVVLVSGAKHVGEAVRSVARTAPPAEIVSAVQAELDVAAALRSVLRFR